MFDSRLSASNTPESRIGRRLDTGRARRQAIARDPQVVDEIGAGTALSPQPRFLEPRLPSAAGLSLLGVTCYAVTATLTMNILLPDVGNSFSRSAFRCWTEPTVHTNGGCTTCSDNIGSITIPWRSQYW